MRFINLQNQKNIAVGLSGGGDSMALTHMLCQWAVENDCQIHALSVNHNLRDDSAHEAELIATYSRDFPNITHQILKWNHDEKTQSAVMERARHARYELMADYCRDHKIETLAVAHHGDDNLETFMFRLAKGSGLKGLTGMSEWSELHGLKIYRPLLSYSHNELIEYCRAHNLQWIEDPSNHNDKYARPRLRKALQNEGFNVDRFAKTLSRLSRAEEALDDIADNLLTNATSPIKSGMVIDWRLVMTYTLDIQIRIVQKVIAAVGDVTHNYPPKLEKIEDILATIQPNKSATLYGCLITLSKDGNTLEVVRS